MGVKDRPSNHSDHGSEKPKGRYQGGAVRCKDCPRLRVQLKARDKILSQMKNREGLVAKLQTEVETMQARLETAQKERDLHSEELEVLRKAERARAEEVVAAEQQLMEARALLGRVQGDAERLGKEAAAKQRLIDQTKEGLSIGAEEVTKLREAVLQKEAAAAAKDLEVAKVTRELADKSIEVSRIGEELRCKEAECSQLKGTVVRLEERVVEQTQHLAEASRSHQAALEQANAAYARMMEERIAVADAEREAAVAEARDEASRVRAQLELAHREAESEARQAQAKAATLSTLKAQLDTREDTLRAVKEQLAEKTLALEDALGRSERHEREGETARARMEERLEDAHNKEARLRAELDSLQAALKHAEEAQHHAVRQAAAVQEEKDELSHRLAGAERKHQADAAAVKQAKDRCLSLKGELEDARDAQARLREMVDEVEQELAETQHHLDASRRREAVLQEDKEELKEEVHALKGKLREAEEAAREHAEERMRMTERMRDDQDAAKASERREQALRSDVDKAKECADVLRAELDQAIAQHQQATSESVAAQQAAEEEAREALRVAHETHRAQLSDAEDRLSAMESAKEEARGQAAHWRERCERAEEACAQQERAAKQSMEEMVQQLVEKEKEAAEEHMAERATLSAMLDKVEKEKEAASAAHNDAQEQWIAQMDALRRTMEEALETAQQGQADSDHWKQQAERWMDKAERTAHEAEEARASVEEHSNAAEAARREVEQSNALLAEAREKISEMDREKNEEHQVHAVQVSKMQDKIDSLFSKGYESVKAEQEVRRLRSKVKKAEKECAKYREMVRTLTKDKADALMSAASSSSRGGSSSSSSSSLAEENALLRKQNKRLLDQLYEGKRATSRGASKENARYLQM